MDDYPKTWLCVVGVGGILFLILPTLVVVPMSFSSAEFLQFPPPGFSLRWYREFFGSYEWTLATKVSLIVAFTTSILATPIGTAAAYAIRVSASPWVNWVRLTLLTPLIIPHIIIAVGVFFLYARVGLNSTIAGLVLVHTMMAIPFVVITVLAGLLAFDLDQERAARTLGFNRFSAFVRVTLPQIRGSVVAGSLFAFISSFDEIVVALFVSGGANSTLTKRMFSSLLEQISPTIAAISSMLVFLTLAIGLSAMVFARQGRG